MTIVNIQCNEEQKEKSAYKMGDCFLVGGDLCMLTAIGIGTFTMTCLDNGNRWYMENVFTPEFMQRVFLKEIKEYLDNDEVVPVKSVNISYEL